MRFLKYFLFIVCLAPVGFTKTISNETKLRKLSLQLRGFPPTVNEYQQLSNIKETEINAFFENTTANYLNSAWGSLKISEKVFEDLRLDLKPDYINTSIWNANDVSLNSSSNLNPTQRTLFSNINLRIKSDERWDNIIINKDIENMNKAFILYDTVRNYYLSFSNNTERYSFENFIQYAKSMGLNFNSEESIKKALSEYDSKPGSFGGNKPLFKNANSDKEFYYLLLKTPFNYGTNQTASIAMFEYLAKIQNPEIWLASVFGPDAKLMNNSFNNQSNSNYLFSYNEMMNRYKKTIYSKAAAFFRIYLCDDMKQVVLSEDKNKGLEIVKKIIDKNSTNNMSNSQSNMATTQKEISHVQSDCIACHRKLDPIEKVVNLKSNGASFEFVYDDYQGKEIRVKVDSISNLPKLLAEQPQFIRCQTEKFWNWYIGEDVPLTPIKHQALMEVYKTSNASPKKMISYLTSLPEYSNDEVSLEPTQFNNVRPILQRCNSCHTNEPGVPSFISLPINNFKQSDQEKLADHLKTIQEIVKDTDLFEQGNKVKMPPKKSGWVLSENERYLLSRWIYFGTRDENGTPLLDAENIKTLFAKVKPDVLQNISKKPQPKITFRNTWNRLIQNFDLLKILPSRIKINYYECFNSFSNNKMAIGQRDANSGVPISDTPTVSFSEVYNNCVIAGINNTKNLFITSPSSPEALYYLKAFGLSNLSNDNININSNWKDLPEKTKSNIISQIVYYQLGPNISSSSQLPQLSGQTIESKLQMLLEKSVASNNNLSIVNAAANSVYFILNQDQFLTF